MLDSILERFPLLIEFTSPTSLLRERDRPSDLRIIGNGPAGTFVLFPDGLRVSLPTDQIVFADDADGHVRVGFGGMQFVGLEQGRLMFKRVLELLPEEQLSPARSHTMLLDPQWVASISVDGRPVWRQVLSSELDGSWCSGMSGTRPGPSSYRSATSDTKN